MSSETIFRIQHVFSYAAWLLCLKFYFWPKLKAMDRVDAHKAIATLHSFRFLGLALILPGFVGPNLPSSFAVFAAYWDLATAALAILALLTVSIRPLFWTFIVAFNLVGLFDLVSDYFLAIRANIPAIAGQEGGAYPLTTLYVPLLMITHFVAFYLLLRPRGGK